MRGWGTGGVTGCVLGGVGMTRAMGVVRLRLVPRVGGLLTPGVMTTSGVIIDAPRSKQFSVRRFFTDALYVRSTA
jgi:hypothetical protein